MAGHDPDYIAGVTLVLNVRNKLAISTLQLVQFEDLTLHVVHSFGHIEQVPKVELSIEFEGHCSTHTPWALMSCFSLV